MVADPAAGAALPDGAQRLAARAFAVGTRELPASSLIPGGVVPVRSPLSFHWSRRQPQCGGLQRGLPS